MTTIDDVILINVHSINEQNGILCSLENVYNILSLPFKNIFYIYNVPSFTTRGNHAHKKMSEYLIPITGSVDVLVNDGKSVKTIKLDSPKRGLYIPAGIWAKEFNFSKNCVLLVIASEFYDKDDYIYDYCHFLNWKQHAS